MHAGRLQLVNCTRVGAYRLSHHYGRYSCFLLHYVWVLCLYQYQSRLMFSTSVRLLPFLWTWYFENPLKWFSCKLAKWFTGRQEDETINFCWVTQGHSKWHPRIGYLYVTIRCLYLLPFLRHLTSNDGATLNSGLDVTQSHWKWYYSRALVRFPICI